MEMLNTIKIHHWKTHSFAKHKATDELYSSLNDLVDTFVETLLGKESERVNMMVRRLPVYDFTDRGVEAFKNKILEYRKFLVDMNLFFKTENDSDLLNIRDEIVGELDKFMYLLTLH